MLSPVMIVIRILVSRCLFRVCARQLVRQLCQVTSEFSGPRGPKKRKDSPSDLIDIARVILRESLRPSNLGLLSSPAPLSSPPAQRPFYLVGETRCELPHTYKPSISRL